MARFSTLLASLIVAGFCTSSLAFQPRPGDPALDGKDYLISEADCRSILTVTRAWLTRTHPSFSVRRVHVVTHDSVEVYVRGRLSANYGEEDDMHSVDLQRTKHGWHVGAHNLERVPTID